MVDPSQTICQAKLSSSPCNKMVGPLLTCPPCSEMVGVVGPLETGY